MGKSFKGAYPVIITPMDQQEEIDWDGLEKNIEYFVNEGVAGLVINGSTGEFVSLTKEERFKVVETAVATINGRIPLLAGTAAETTRETIEYTQQAEAAGADGALVINSYYAHPTEEEIYEHFKAVAASVQFPIMIYNNPSTSGVDISTETILRIGRDIENITHVKESSGDIRKVRDVTRKGKGCIKTYCGADDLVLESFLVGATGWISVAGNVAPKLATDLFEAVQNNELEKAWDLYDQLLPLCSFIEDTGKYVQIIKHAMDVKGLAGGPSRKPRLPLTSDEKATLNNILDKLLVTQN